MELKHEADALVAEFRQFAFRHCRHVDTVVNDAARVGLVESSRNLEQRCLSGAVGPQNKTTFSALHLAGNIVQDFVPTQVYPGVFYIDGR